jgi:hypothetical protein
MGTFYSDVIAQDPRFTSTSRISDPELLEPITRDLVEGIIAAAEEQGFDLMIFETYRSQERQEQLFLQGATQLRRVGVHHFGLACDIVRSVNGEPSWKGDFSIVGQLAQSAGLVWGGIGAIPVSTTVSLTSLTCRDAPSLDKRHCSLVSGIRMTRTTRWTKNRICCSLLSPGKPANAHGRKQSVHRANAGGQKINHSDLATL